MDAEQQDIEQQSRISARDVLGTVVACIALLAGLWYITSTPQGRTWAKWNQPPPVAALSLVDEPTRQVGISPPPTLKRVGTKIVKGKKMPVYNTINPQPGNTDFCGPWTQGGAYNERVTASNANGKVIWYFGLGYWLMSGAAGDCANYTDAPYRAMVADPEDTSLPMSPWEVGTGLTPGTEPAPTLSEYAAPVAGVSDPYLNPWENYWLTSGGVDAPSVIAPCRATLGTADCVVLPYHTTLDGSGLFVFDLGTHEFTKFPFAAGFFEYGDWDNERNTAACYDAGDGSHVWLVGGKYSSAGLYMQVVKLLVDGGVSEVSRVTVPLPAASITPLLQLADGTTRFVARDDITGTLSYHSYTLGDATCAEVVSFTGFGNYEPVPTFHSDGSTALALSDVGEVFFMRYFYGLTGGHLQPYRITPLGCTRLNDTLAMSGEYPTFGTYGYPAGTIIAETGYSALSSGLVAAAWQPGTDGVSRAPFCAYPMGRHWLISGDSLLAAGWGAGSAAGQPFVLYAQPATVNVGATAETTVAGNISLARTLPVGAAAETTVAGDITLVERKGIAVGAAQETTVAGDITLLVSTVRTPAACTVDVYEVRAMALPA